MKSKPKMKKDWRKWNRIKSKGKRKGTEKRSSKRMPIS